MKVLSIFGTRPEAVKMAPVVRKLAETEGIQSSVCVTAQHREMLDQVLHLFDIDPDIDLNLMRPDQSISSLCAAIFSSLSPVLEKLEPDWVIVQGDTTTVMAAALVAYYHGVKVGHVEAGLRTGDKWQPFPEEINRRVASVAADLHFAPTEWSVNNLLKENIPQDQIVLTGNPVIDALQSVRRLPIPDDIRKLLDENGVINHAGNGSKKLVVVTAHRRENFGKPLEDICHAILRLAIDYKETVHIVYPVHLNPNVQEPVYRLLNKIDNISLLPPLDYLPFVHLLDNSYLVMTDSGGLQEEAPGLGVPVLVMRDVTERPEGIEAGTVRLVGTKNKNIYSEATRLIDNPALHRSMAKAVNPYGDGHAAVRIVDALLAY